MTHSASLHDETAARLERMKVLMVQHHIDALLLFNGPNMVYFAGTSAYLGGRSGSRPSVYLLPQRDDQPTLIVHDGPYPVVRALARVSDIRTYSSLSHVPLEVLRGVLSDQGLLRGRIGLELGMEMVLDLPQVDFLALREALPEAEFVDASALLWQLRMVKSETEIASVARACAITAEAYERTFAAVVSAMSEAEIELMMCGHMLAQGGYSPWCRITSGAGNYDLIGKGGSQRMLKEGDMLWMDCGCSIQGYWSDFSRAGVVGGPSTEQAETHRAVHEITRMGVEMVRPGVALAEIAARCNEALDALDVPVTSNITQLAARAGHGLGLQAAEPPSVNAEDPTVLVPGIIVTIEPGVATPYGTFHVEEVVVVTEQGPRVLSPERWELRTIPLIG